MNCTNCGNYVPDGTAFCPRCGAAVTAPNQQMYQQQNFVNNVPGAQPAKGLAVASLVMGILSFFVLPIVTGLLGIIFGATAKSKGSRSPMATAGLVCGIIGIVAWVIMIIAWQNAVSNAMNVFSSF